MDLIYLALGLLIGFGAGWMFSRLKTASAAKSASQTVPLDQFLELNRKLGQAESQSMHREEQLKNQKEYLEEVKKQTRAEFENLAQQILESKTKIFNQQTETSVENLLKPLREKLTTFEKRVEDTYNNEAKERYALKSEVGRLILLNEKMTHETTQLTQALKGDSKFQGDWGELILENILEASGLRKGHDYILQTEHENEAGDRYKPDAVVNLPEGKHIIVDSKVSLKAYELYCRAEAAVDQALQLKDLIRSIYKHIDDLSNKHYAKLKGIKSPDFVFLFMPIEPAYLLAVQNDPELSQKAWRKNVAIVTSTTLLTSLRTVASIWRLENQKKNADEIASEAAKLYDKFVGFMDDFEDIGRTFQKGQTLYSSALGKLKEGPGNVFRKMEQLRELGAEPNKRIKSELLE